MLKDPRKQQGFTLMELLVVMTIIAILATIGLAGYRHKTTLAREAVLKEDLFQVRHSLEQYRADRGKLPSSLQPLKDLGYLREIPVDPMTNSRDTWALEFEAPDPDNPDAETGVYNIRSGSTDLGENGIPYNEW
ncbi:MAG TPA: prepilin-type N-terminal cleavage/methylation domain-containing protein [Holophagaceae bacterium]|jgi:general secretion pathway protein G|nr:prepilin-type N-terminal cleavage/methylation domain-containing protein [Holophagaceae bacterium]